MNWQNRKALLYCRISTDDQSNYSLIDQQERLVKFCGLMKVTVVKLFRDDYSAKTFDRPGWKQMSEWIKNHKGSANLLLFTNWSRFSRSENMGDTYYQIASLSRLGIECQASEQMIDLSIPESHHLLSIYLTSPMVENLRRASNTRFGMRRSLRQGRFCWKAPFGYRNSHDETDKPLLVPIPERARIIESIFQEYLEGADPKLIIARAKQRGLIIQGHDVFPRIITNHLYAGLVRIKAYGDEPEEIIKGVHEAIISEDIFHAANKKLKYGLQTKPRVYSETLPLRGVICCDNCGGHLTGGKSKGKTGNYWNYYRCLRCKGCNFNANRSHSELNEILSAISLTEPQIKFFCDTVDEELKSLIKSSYDEKETLERQIKELEIKIASLETKYIENALHFEVYQKYYPALKGEVSEKRLRLEALSQDRSDVIELYRQALPKMTNLSFLYDECSLEDKQMFLKLIFPGGLYKLKNGGFRTIELNPLFVEKLIINNLVIADKAFNLTSSHRVPQAGMNSNSIEALLRFVLKLAA
jgi:site-specific DNA recombinase